MCYILTHSATLMALLEQLREELLTHIIPKLSHSWKTPMHQWCVLYGLPWKTPLHHSMNIQLLLLQQAGNARSCDCQGKPVPLPILYFTALLFNTTQTPCITHRQAFPHPNNSIINAKYRNSGEENPPSSQQGPTALLG